MGQSAEELTGWETPGNHPNTEYEKLKTAEECGIF
jgi:hypothetical protein